MLTFPLELMMSILSADMNDVINMADRAIMEAIANAIRAKPHKMAWGVVRFFICLSFDCCGARIADLNSRG